jgi:hypothetical protein
MWAQATPFDWGTWRLGDLPEVLSRAMDVLGASAAVVAARVEPPQGSQVLPAVHLEVADQEESARLRGEVGACEFVSCFDPDYGATTGAAWWPGSVW